MKEMQDNNLFGDDSQPSTPVPKITEISLKDITQVVDLDEFRKQNLELKGNCSDFLLPVKDDDSSTNAAFDWTPPPSNTLDLSSEILTTCVFNEKRADDSVDTIFTARDDNKTNSVDQFSKKRETSSHSKPFFDTEPNLETISETGSLKAESNVYGVQSKHEFCLHTHNKTPNGDMFSEEYRPKRKELSFSKEACSSRTESNDPHSEAGSSAIRRLSIPEIKSKDSRTFHPRKRQTVHGNRREKCQTNFDIENVSKEELLLMWKSSELELSDKLEAAVKDKQRLETKLTALKLHMSTPV